MKNIKGSVNLPNFLSFNYEVADDDQSIVNLFGRYFISTYNKVNNLSPIPPVIESSKSIYSYSITRFDIIHELENLNLKNSIGPYGIFIIYFYIPVYLFSFPL